MCLFMLLEHSHLMFIFTRPLKYRGKGVQNWKYLFMLHFQQINQYSQPFYICNLLFTVTIYYAFLFLTRLYMLNQYYVRIFQHAFPLFYPYPL